MTTPAPGYIHGTHAGEQQRLAAMNALINRASLEPLAPRRGERLVDFGCGLGQFARDVARVTGVPALGIERSAEQLERARALAREAGEEPLAEFRAGDATAPPLTGAEWGAFDIAHARFLLEHVPDPLAVVRQMARAVRPGGRVVLADDDHEALRLWPEPPQFATIWRAYTRTYDRNGSDPLVGRRLVELLARAGLAPRRIALPLFGACSGDPSFAPLVRNVDVILRGAREPILATGGVAPDAFEEGLRAVEAFGRRGDAAIWYCFCWAEGLRP